MAKYPLTGPFTNGTTPGLSATLFNNLETYLEYAADSNITTDGNGNLSMVSVVLTHGAIARIAFGFSSVTTGGTVVTHNLGVAPSGVFVQVAGISATAFVTNYTSTTTMTVTVSTNCNVWWLAIA